MSKITWKRDSDGYYHATINGIKVEINRGLPDVLHGPHVAWYIALNGRYENDWCYTLAEAKAEALKLAGPVEAANKKLEQSA